MVEAYSHECSSCGFWPGTGPVEGSQRSIRMPTGACRLRRACSGSRGSYYHRELREFVLPYEVVRTAPSPDDALLEFAQSTYEAAAEHGAGDRHAALDRRA